MKKGFTLIELLAVIVILALIALISVPMILGIIEKVKKGALEATANGLLESATLYYAKNLSTIGENKVFLFDETHDGETTDNIKLTYKGNFKGTGSVRIYKDGKTAICIQDEKYYAIKNINNTKVTTGTGTCSYDEATNTYLSVNLVSQELVDNLQEQLDNLQSNYNELQSNYDSLLAEKQTVITSLSNKGVSTTGTETLTEIAAKIDAMAIGKQVVLLGTGPATYDVTSYPGYQSFTASNFIVEGYSGAGATADHNRGASATAYIGKTYNATTGKLTVTNGSASGDVSNSVLKYIYGYAHVNKVYLVY
ncbi:MAG: prepilin-type N-terminal cleavage/methylation domain-containing protein [Bacilli bacterium]|nr:prepilin-type N-terminal cleavage/methylation domain-containing protein [Bacilli bacterium]